MKQVYCICCAGAMFFCLFRYLCAACGRGTVRRKTEFCAAAVFLLFFRVRFSAQIFFAGQKSLGLFFILTQIADIIKLYFVVYFMAQRRTRCRAKPLRCCRRNKTTAANAFWAAGNRNGFRLIFYNPYILFVFSRKEFF